MKTLTIYYVTANYEGGVYLITTDKQEAIDYVGESMVPDIGWDEYELELK
tara:strand:- start:5183 stop:5332 length:150 start_codon:yes stop_codon:yes gene_type:complete